MNPDILSSLIAQWAREDARMPPGYVASPSVLQERLLSVRLDTLKSALYNVRTDVWLDRDGRRFHVGVRDNCNPVEYNATLPRLGARARMLGWRTRLCNPRGFSALCTLSVWAPDVTREAETAHLAYVRALKTERAALAQRDA